ncbi:hypothetical protein [Noviherbaspirillum massiliense]|uniref:hypothetical protein n=1 Tax=Noviherbaspirillum massiliense TaxID=1465823 RepID=UPI0011DD371C|nr:hypothetical protein [Noviherbaspirillum massiliense]
MSGLKSPEDAPEEAGGATTVACVPVAVPEAEVVPVLAPEVCVASPSSGEPPHALRMTAAQADASKDVRVLFVVEVCFKNFIFPNCFATISGIVHSENSAWKRFPPGTPNSLKAMKDAAICAQKCKGCNQAAQSLDRKD